MTVFGREIRLISKCLSVNKFQRGSPRNLSKYIRASHGSHVIPSTIRFYTREAATVLYNNATSSYSSGDLDGKYHSTCEYFPQCALAAGSFCSGDDRFELTSVRGQLSEGYALLSFVEWGGNEKCEYCKENRSGDCFGFHGNRVEESSVPDLLSDPRSKMKPTQDSSTHVLPAVHAAREYTFRGQVGKITFVPDDPDRDQFGVTFNDGRTSYFFSQEHLQVEQDYNYEVKAGDPN